jgi:hypothetical protein
MKKQLTRTSTESAAGSSPRFLKVASIHISVQGAVAFLLHGQNLTPSEEEHLLRCDACRRMMVEAAASSSPHIAD